MVGLGWGAKVAASLVNCREVRLAACHARSESAREAFAATYGLRAYATYDGMIHDDALDGIVIMTPNDTHRDLAIAALRAGRHVLVTKPIAPSLTEAAEMIQVARETRRILAVGHQSRRHPALRTLKRWVDAGDLGAPRLIEGNTSSPTGLTVSPADWRAQPAACPGGPLIQLGIHYVDNYQHLLGPVSRVSGWLGKLGGGPVDPDTTSMLLGFSSGAVGYLSSSYVIPSTRWIRLTGEQATAGFQADGGLVLHSAAGAVLRSLPPPAEGIEGVRSAMLAGEVIEFAQCIQSGTEPEIGGTEAARNLAVVLAAVESHLRRAPVAVDELLRAAGL